LFVTVLSTAPSEAEAETIAEALVVEKLAACVQFTPVRSRYVWKDELVRDDEVLLIIKSRRGRVEGNVERNPARDGFEVPEVVMLEIADGASDYLAWIEDRTRASP
jgi:uncharacterized protein involved in tolerance to divalent cations